MNARTRQSLLAAAVVLLGGAGLSVWAYLRTYKGGLEQDASQKSAARLFSFVPVYVQGGAIKNDKVEVEFRVKDGSFVLTKPLAVPADDEALSAAVVRTAALSLSPEISADATPAELTTYGLEHPSAEISITDADGKQNVLRVGEMNEMLKAVYVAGRVGVGPWRLGIVDAQAVWAVQRDLYAYRTKRLFRTPRDRIQKIRAEKEGKLVYALERSGKRWTVSGSVNPPAGGASTFTGDPAMSDRFALILTRDLNIEEVVTDHYTPADAARYGLDAPRFTVTTEADTGAIDRVHFGVVPKADGTVQVFALAEGSESVAVAYSDFLHDVDKTADDFRDRSLSTFDTSAVTRIEIALMGQRSIVLTAEAVDGGAGPRWRASAPKKGYVKADRVEAMLLRLGRLRSDRIVIEAASGEERRERGLEPPERRILLQGKGGLTLADITVGKPMDKDHVFIAAAGLSRIDAIKDAELKMVPYALDEILEETTP
jgi:hypothetical protein